MPDFRTTLENAKANVKNASAVGVELLLDTAALPLMAAGYAAKKSGDFGYKVLEVSTAWLETDRAKQWGQNINDFLETPAGKVTKIVTLPITVPLWLLDKATGFVFDKGGEMGTMTLDTAFGSQDDARMEMSETMKKNRHRVFIAADTIDDVITLGVAGLAAGGVISPMLALAVVTATSITEYSLLAPTGMQRIGEGVMEKTLGALERATAKVNKAFGVEEREPIYEKLDRLATQLAAHRAPALARG